MSEAEKPFHVADYIVFACSLGISLLVGIIFAIKDKWHRQSTESYLMADRNMNWILVGFSFWATVVSAGFFVGLTTEFYFYGITALWFTLARYIGAAFTVLVVIPKFFRMKFTITSAYEYFERRFNLPVRLAVGLMFVFMKLLSAAVALYGPCLVLAKVSVIPLEWCIALGAVVCLIYTGFGGIKAVIWVDAIQVLIMTIGCGILAGYGVIAAGGLTKVWQIYTELGERNNWDDIDPSPWNRHTVWSGVFLHGILYAGMFSSDQSVLQRYMTVPNMRLAQYSVLLGVTIGVGFAAIVLFLGAAAFANVGGNDPYLNKQIERPDQILAYFLMHILGDYHGLPGLVVAALFAAGLSTMSSMQNAMATVICKDLIQPIYSYHKGKELKTTRHGLISRLAGVSVGIASLVLGEVVPYFNDTLLSMSLSVGSFITGPVLGLMIAGLFCFWIEEWGALVGLVCSLAWALMMYFGSMFNSHGVGKERKPLFNNNFTDAKYFIEPDVNPSLFDVSYTWYVFMDAMIVLIVATIISLIIHCCRKKGCPKKSNITPDRDLRYNKHDLRAAVGCKSRKEPSVRLIGIRNDIIDVKENGHTKENHDYDKKQGIDNIAFEADKRV